MSRARAATPAAKRRAGARKARAKGGSAPARGAAPAKPKRARQAPKRAAPKRTTAKRTTAKRSTRGRTTAAGRRTRAAASPRRTRTRRAWSRPRPLRALRRGFAASSWRYRLGVLLIVAVAAGAGYLFWLRDSSFVAVTDVEVAGVASGDREAIVAELTRLAEQQTTLHADPGKIERAAAAFPTVKSVSVDPNFPHGMRIEVTERPPALVVESDGERIAVAADATLLTGVAVPDDGQLPVLEVGELPARGTLDGEPFQQALILGAAPEPLKPLIHAVRVDDQYGVEATLRGGIPVRFGSGSAAAEKWAAAAAVLASPKVDALTYVDVRVPERPTVGGNG